MKTTLPAGLVQCVERIQSRNIKSTIDPVDIIAEHLAKDFSPQRITEFCRVFWDTLPNGGVAWDTVSGAFPAGLDDAAERLVRRVAFGYWPETEAETGILLGIDWLEVTKNIRVAAEVLKNTASELTRNALTLAGARLALYALSWLHCFVALEPELERRRREGVDEDGRTGPIAAELYNNFGVWVNQLREVVSESGMEFAEAGRIEAMGLRLRALCGG